MPPHTKRWFPPFGFHTHSFMQASSAMSFRLLPGSISAAASSGSPLLSSFRFLASLGPSFHGFYPASGRLSDLRCFRFLSSASVLDSDYSASVSSFPSLHRSASQWLSDCFLPLSLPDLPLSSPPGFPCFNSSFQYSAFLYVSFHPSLIRSHSCSSGACFRIFRFPSASFRPLPFHFRLLSLTVLPFCLLPVFASQRLHGALRFLSSPLLFPFSPARFPVHSFRFCLLGFLLVSFRPSLLRSRSCSTGDSLLNFFSGTGA